MPKIRSATTTTKYPIPPRILFVTPEAVFRPEDGDDRTYSADANGGNLDSFPAELISELFEFGADVCVAQPDFRNIFKMRSRKDKTGKGGKLPYDRFYLAEDRSIFYSKPINSNSECENIKISLAFQREVINQIIPRVQPDLIHCYDWMTGLIPAAARFFKIPCLFTAQKFDTARSYLSYVEDRGIDAAVFWQHLFYDRYPLNYEETRETNPADFLLSGVFAANFVTTSRLAFLLSDCRDQSRFVKFPLWQVLAKKIESGCAIVNQHRSKMEQYIEIYQKLLQQGILAPKHDGFNVLNVRSHNQ
jgi:starch synthase